MSHTHCYLCGLPLEAPISVDHVAPLLFFPKELRKTHKIDKLLTIPVHAACNLAYQLDEEYFVHTLLPMTRGSEAGDAHHFRVRAKLDAGKNVPLVNMVMDEEPESQPRRPNCCLAECWPKSKPFARDGINCSESCRIPPRVRSWAGGNGEPTSEVFR